MSHIPADTVSAISREATNAYYRIGVSATPWRDDGADLLIESVLNKRKPENNINATKLIELGFLVPCTIYFVPMKKIVQGKNYNKVYTEAIINNEERNKNIVNIAYNMVTKQKMTTLILIQRIEHGEKIQKMLFDKIPMKTFLVQVEDDRNGKMVTIRVKNIEFLSGQDDAIRRKAVLKAVKEGKVDILVGSTIADEGLITSSL